MLIRAELGPDDLVGRCGLRDHLLVMASPALVRPARLVDGKSARVAAVVRAIGEDTGPWVVEGDGGRFVLDPDPVLRLSTLAIRDAVRPGPGRRCSRASSCGRTSRAGGW